MTFSTASNAHSGQCMSINPYEPPSPAVLEEAQRAPKLLAISQRTAVQWFITLNRMAGTAILGTGVAITLLCFVINLGNLHNIATRPVLASMGLGIAIVALGNFQLKRSIFAITFTGAIVVSLYTFVVVATLLNAVGLGLLPNARPVPLVAALVGLVILTTVFGALVYVPAWLTLRAWLWRLQGIDLISLEKTEYR